jgi:hypothetical protein
LIENEARGELILVDKAKALIELEQDFRKNLNDEKDSEESSESFSFDRRKDNYKKTSIFVNYLKDNGYSVSEGQLGLFRFTANKLTGNLDRFLNQGMGSPQIIKIRAVYNNLKSIVKESEFNDYCVVCPLIDRLSLLLWHLILNYRLYNVMTKQNYLFCSCI